VRELLRCKHLGRDNAAQLGHQSIMLNGFEGESLENI
jgi:hypothetical protein